MLSPGGISYTPPPDPPADSGPGGQTLLYTYQRNPSQMTGYYGRVPASNLVTQSELSTLTGYTSGTVLNESPDWLKFFIDGKVLFIPQKPLRFNVSGKSIYDKGIMTGSKDVVYPNLTYVPQNKIINVKGYNFIVRVMTVGYGGRPEDVNSYGVPQVDSEWNRLIYNVFSGSLTDMRQGGIWDSLTDSDLGIIDRANGTGTIGMDKVSATVNGFGARGFAGYVDGGYVYITTYDATDRKLGWRPVLELVT